VKTVAQDIAGFERLYADHWHWLRNWLSRQTRCHLRAEDIAQDTFCRILERQSGSSARDPRAYLAQIARRLLIDDVRRRKVEQAILAALADDDFITDMTPERIAIARQILTTLLRILDALPMAARDAFILRRVEGLEQQQIADRLGISLSSVRRYIAQAYAQCYAISCLD
jgi:RNA polymerase sigma factor (sigma-70 family)